jgi:hypothetical protein
MEISAHREKMARLEELRLRLDPEDDFELWMWASMTAATNGLNACMHHLKLTEPKPYYPHQIPGLYVSRGPDGRWTSFFADPGDVIHFGLPPVKGKVPQVVLDLSVQLGVLDDLREPFVRGGEPITPEIVARCQNAYEKSIATIDQILSSR